METMLFNKWIDALEKEVA